MRNFSTETIAMTMMTLKLKTALTIGSIFEGYEPKIRHFETREGEGKPPSHIL
jgi:hypothetical protein